MSPFNVVNVPHCPDCNSPRLGNTEFHLETCRLFVLAKATDDQLRAECERRFAGPVNEYTRLSAEHEELKAELQRALDGHNVCGGKTFKLVQRERDLLLREKDSLLAERDEWKRRAMLLEATVARTKSEERRQRLVTPAIDTPEKLARVLEGGRPHECGDGIAAQRPDNSISHLPEDLLCDDA